MTVDRRIRTATRSGAKCKSYGRGEWMCLDISDGGEEKCIGRNSWPKCDRCACVAAADGRADFHGDILFLLYIYIRM